MPTSYTSPVGKGEITFEEFVVRCAHAFVIDMRDAPLDAPLPKKHEVRTYHRNSLLKETRELEKVLSWDEGEAERQAYISYEERVRVEEEYRYEKKVLLENYEAMLEQVEAWEPPTENHEGLKKFMIEQLESSIKYDCRATEHTPELESGETHREQRLLYLLRAIQYSAEKYAEEIERAKHNTAWVAALHENLQQVAT